MSRDLGPGRWLSTWRLDAGASLGFVTSRAAMMTVVIAGEIHIEKGSPSKREAVVTLGTGEALLSLGRPTYGIECVQSAHLIVVDLPLFGLPSTELRVVRALPLAVHAAVMKAAEAAADPGDPTTTGGWLSVIASNEVPDLIAQSARVAIHPVGHSTAKMATVKEALEREYRTRIRLGSLAERFGVGRSYLSRNFREAFSLSPSQYLHALRRESFLRSLVLGRGPLTARAAASGLYDYVNLCHRFRREVGASPSQLARKDS